MKLYLKDGRDVVAFILFCIGVFCVFLQFCERLIKRLRRLFMDMEQNTFKSMPDVPAVTAVATAEEACRVSALRADQFCKNCIICLSPTNSRCSGCKQVNYCSRECQIIHWWQGHNKECQTVLSGIAAADQTPQQMPYLRGSKSRQNVTLDETSDKKPSTHTDERFNIEKGESSISQQAKCRNEDSTNADSLFPQVSKEDSKLVIHAFEKVSQVNVKAKMACHDKFKPAVPVKEAKVEVPALRDTFDICTMCSAPARTRCARCKMFHYCSGRCQIIHWREGHKKECQSLSPIISVATRPKSLHQQMYYMANFNSPPYRSGTNKCDIQEGTSDDQSGLQTKNGFINSSENGMSSKLRETKLKDEEVVEANSSFCNNSSEVSSDGEDANCMEFSYLELKEATNNFDEKLKIGEGGYGSVYKGVLHCTTVAIKILHKRGNQGEREFYQEVDVLRKVRHPNIVTLIGGCSQKWALIYEFIPNGSLENYLSTSSGRKSLIWKTRVQIASDICSALIFLHLTKAHGIAHGDLKPANILLDSNYLAKLSDFGISRQLIKTHDTITPHHLTEHPKGTLAYIDPEYLRTGEMNPQCDVYSFGVILLQLVTGKSATGIIKSVQDALKENKFKKEVDASAKWPASKAIKMAKLGLSCCKTTRKKRPNLRTEVWSEIASL